MQEKFSPALWIQTLLSETVGEGIDGEWNSQLHVYLVFYSWWRQPERKICGRLILSLTELCLFPQKNGKLQFEASSTRSNLMPESKQHGNTLLGSLFIFSSTTVCLQFLAMWTLTFFLYYSDFIPYEYEQEIGKNYLLRQNSNVPLKKKACILSFKSKISLVYFQRTIYFTVIWIASEAEKIPQLGNDGKLLEVLKHTETHIIAVRLKN